MADAELATAERALWQPLRCESFRPLPSIARERKIGSPLLTESFFWHRFNRCSCAHRLPLPT
jgi:hypothetical protein